MEKSQLLDSIFETFLHEVKSEKEELISSVLNNDYNLEKYKKCSRIKTIVAHLFFMSILKKTSTDLVNENDEFVKYIRWHSVNVKQFDSIVPNVEVKTFSDRTCKNVKSQKIKMQAKKLMLQSKNNLNAARCLKFNEFFSQSVHYSQMSVELAIKSILKAKNVPHYLWRSQHSIVHLGNLVKCGDKQFVSFCNSLENLGIKVWKNVSFEKSATLSIRTRYCDYDDCAFFYLDTLPDTVFSSRLAKKAYTLSEQILMYCENILNEQLLTVN